MLPSLRLPLALLVVVFVIADNTGTVCLALQGGRSLRRQGIPSGGLRTISAFVPTTPCSITPMCSVSMAYLSSILSLSVTVAIVVSVSVSVSVSITISVSVTMAISVSRVSAAFAMMSVIRE